MNKIPVIGAPVVRNPEWIRRQIESVDYPVENYIIFNNNGKGEIDEELDKLVAEPHKFIDQIRVCHLPANIGTSGAWNLIIKSFMLAPYWIIANDDVSFAEGFLQEMNEKAQDDEVGMIHGYEGDFQGLGSWNLFLIKDWVIQQVGLFDENMYPAYCEDTDYCLRILHLERSGNGIKRIMNLDTPYYHGRPPDATGLEGSSKGIPEEYYNYGMMTSQGDDELRQKLEFANFTNFEYMEKKWGPWWRTMWGWDDGPFGSIQEKDETQEGKYPLSYTTYDLGFVRKKHTGF